MPFAQSASPTERPRADETESVAGERHDPGHVGCCRLHFASTKLVRRRSCDAVWLGLLRHNNPAVRTETLAPGARRRRLRSCGPRWFASCTFEELIDLHWWFVGACVKFKALLDEVVTDEAGTIAEFSAEKVAMLEKRARALHETEPGNGLPVQRPFTVPRSDHNPDAREQ
jgi:hypothetical protein